MTNVDIVITIQINKIECNAVFIKRFPYRSKRLLQI